MSKHRKLRLGVVGLGRAFTLMLPTFLADNRVQLVGAADPRGQARAQFERDIGVPAHERVEDLMRQADVDAVYVATPHQMHLEHVQLAAAYRKHVLLEKPMALTKAECELMIQSCRLADVALVVGHSHSFDAPYASARSLIQQGTYGAIRMINAMQCTDFLYRPRRPEELDTRLEGRQGFM